MTADEGKACGKSYRLKRGGILEDVIACGFRRTKPSDRAAAIKFKSSHCGAVLECGGADGVYACGDGDALKSGVVVERLCTNGGKRIAELNGLKSSTALKRAVGNCDYTGKAYRSKAGAVSECVGVGRNGRCPLVRVNLELNKRLGKVDGLECSTAVECLSTEGCKLAVITEGYRGKGGVVVERLLTYSGNSCGNGDLCESGVVECSAVNLGNSLLNGNAVKLSAAHEEVALNLGKSCGKSDLRKAVALLECICAYRSNGIGNVVNCDERIVAHERISADAGELDVRSIEANGLKLCAVSERVHADLLNVSTDRNGVEVGVTECKVADEHEVLGKREGRALVVLECVVCDGGYRSGDGISGGILTCREAVDGRHILAVKNAVNNGKVGVLRVYDYFLELRNSSTGREGTEYGALLTGGVNVVEHLGSEGLVKGDRLDVACTTKEVVGNELSSLGEDERGELRTVLEHVSAGEGLELFCVREVYRFKRSAKTEGLGADILDLAALSEGNGLKSCRVEECAVGFHNACGNNEGLDLRAVHAVCGKRGKRGLRAEYDLKCESLLFIRREAGVAECACKCALAYFLNTGEVVLNYSCGVECVLSNRYFACRLGNVKCEVVCGSRDSVSTEEGYVRGKVNGSDGVIGSLVAVQVAAEYCVGVVSKCRVDYSSTNVKKLLAVVGIRLIVLLEGNGLDNLNVSKRTVLNESYGLGNGYGGNTVNDNALVKRRTVEKSYGNAARNLVKHAGDGLILCSAVGNVDILKSVTAREYVRNAGYHNVRVERSASDVFTKLGKSCGKIDRGELGCVLERFVSDSESCGALVKGYRLKLRYACECASADAGYVSGDVDGGEIGALKCVLTDLGNVRAKSDGGKTRALEHICTDVGSSVLEVDGVQLGAAEEYALGAGVYERNHCRAFATVNGNGFKLGTVRECTCANGGYLCRDIDRGELVVHLERIGADGYDVRRHLEACKVGVKERCLADRYGVRGKRCRGECLAVCKCVLLDNESSACSCASLICKSSKCGAVGECCLTDLGHTLLDLEGCKGLVAGECCISDSSDGSPRKCVKSSLVNRKSSGVVDKSGVALVVKNTEGVGYEHGVVLVNLDLGKSGTAVKYGTVKCGNGGGKVYGGDLLAVCKCRITESDVTVASLGEVNLEKLGAVLECSSADAGNGSRNAYGSDLGALERIVADLVDVNVASKVDCSELCLVLEGLVADGGDLNTVAKGNGFDVCITGCRSKRLCTDGDSTFVDVGIGVVAADNNGLKCVTVSKCRRSDAEIDESVACDGYGLNVLTTGECTITDRLNVHGDSDGGESGTVVECISTDVEDSGRNGKVTAYGKGSVKDGVLIAVSEHTVNGGVNGAALFNVDGGKLSKLVKHVGVVELSDLCGEGDLGDVARAVEDAVGRTALAAHKNNVLLSAALELNLGKSLTGVERSLIDSGYVLGDDNLFNVGVLEYLVTNGGYALGSLERTGLCSREYLENYGTHIVTDKSSVVGGVDYFVLTLNLVHVDSLKAGVAYESTRADKLDGVGNVDGNEELLALKCVLNYGSNSLSLVCNGNGDVGNLVKVRACSY